MAYLGALLDRLEHADAVIPTLTCRFPRAGEPRACLFGRATMPRRGTGGCPLRVIVVAHDIDAQRRAAAGQPLSAALFQDLHEGLLTTDANHRGLDTNPTFFSLTGYSLDNL